MAYVYAMTPQWSRFGEAFSRARGSTPKTELSDASGISRRSLTRWETEGAEPSLDQLRTLIQVLPEGAEDMLQALGLLPPSADPQDGLSSDEQAIWDLGERRGWSEDARMRLIYAHRAWEQEQDDVRVGARYAAFAEREHEAAREAIERLG